MEENRDNGTKSVFVREFARAVPWGIVVIITFLICFGITIYGGKNVINYAQENAADTIRRIVTDPVLVEGIKRNVKEGVEYTLTRTKTEVRSVLTDPELKQDMKEALEYTGEKIRK